MQTSTAAVADTISTRMSTSSKEYPKNPKDGDLIIVTRKASPCECVYDIRCRWSKSMRSWMYISEQWCKQHGTYGDELLGVRVDDGTPLAGPPKNPIVAILDYERDTNGGHVPLDVMRAFLS